LPSWSDCPQCEKCKSEPYNTVAEGIDNAYWVNCFDCGYWESYCDEIWNPDTGVPTQVEWAVRSGYDPIYACPHCTRGMMKSKTLKRGTTIADKQIEWEEFACGVCFFAFRILPDGSMSLVRKPLTPEEQERANAERVNEMPERFRYYPIGYGDVPADNE